MKNAWVLLANGDLARRLFFLHPQSKCPALIPVHTKTLLQTLLEYSDRRAWAVYVVVNEAHRAEIGFFQKHYPDVRFLFVKSQKGVIDTLEEALPLLGEHPETCINPITTILEKLPSHEAALFGAEKVFSNQYSGLLDSGEVFSKGGSLPANQNMFPFTGVIRAKTAELRASLARIKNTFDLMELVKELRKENPHFAFLNTSWLDFGHDFSFFDSRAKLLSSRSFNRVEVDADGRLRKSSKHVDKLKQECDFLNCLPPELGVYFPRVFGPFEAANGIGRFDSEFYAYPCVSELFLHWDLHEEVWRKLFSRLETILRSFKKHTAQADEKLLRELFIQKNLARHQAYLAWLQTNDPSFFAAIQKPLKINGTACRPFAEIQQHWTSFLEEKLSARSQTVMHGDFCFNNILFEPSVGLVKLIDARGSLDGKTASIFGDQRYDLAKLLHSAVGGYDFFVNDYFALNEVEGGFDYSLKESSASPIVRRLATELLSSFDYDSREIQVHMANLFLSMPLLHSDNPARQKAMYLHGLRLLCDVFGHA